jgi:hypothetical protein
MQGEPKKEGDSKGRRYPAAWAYLRSFAWVRPIAILAVLYICALSIILVLFYQLPSLSQLAGARRGLASGSAGSGRRRPALCRSALFVDPVSPTPWPMLRAAVLPH